MEVFVSVSIFWVGSGQNNKGVMVVVMLFMAIVVQVQIIDHEENNGIVVVINQCRGTFQYCDS